MRAVVGEPIGDAPLKTLCPVHDEDTPSLAVYPDHAHCFGCGARLDFHHAVRLLRPDLARLSGPAYTRALGAAWRPALPTPRRADVDNLATVAFVSYRQALADSSALAWYWARGLDYEAVVRYGLGCTGTAYTIPLTARAGQFWGLKYRTRRAAGSDLHAPKYWSPAGQRAGLLVPRLARSSGTVVLTEGELDALLLDHHGVPAVSLTAGSRHQDAGLLEGWDRVLVAYDADAPGGKGAAAILDALGGRGQAVTWPHELGKDPTELWQSGHLTALLDRLATLWN